MTNKLSFDIPDYKKIRVIIDTDAACEADDPFAISHALMCRKLIVKGITAEHFVEEGSVQKSLAEVNTILDAMDITDVKSYIGQTKPFSEYEKEELSPAAKFIIEEANRKDDHPLFVLCIGATTNLAYALKAEPSIAEKMTVISIIGHNYSDPLPWREFNAYNDIDAINYILESGVEFWQVPSDVYGSMLVSLAELESKVLPYGKIGHHLFTQIVEYNMTERAAWTQGESWALGDSPAVGIAMYPRCGKYVEREAKLFNHDELTSYGEKIPGRKIRVYESVDSHFILEDFFAKLKLNFSK